MKKNNHTNQTHNGNIIQKEIPPSSSLFKEKNHKAYAKEKNDSAPSWRTDSYLLNSKKDFKISDEDAIQFWRTLY
jgi:hypothetical protein